MPFAEMPQLSYPSSANHDYDYDYTHLFLRGSANGNTRTDCLNSATRFRINTLAIENSMHSMFG